MGIPSGTHSPPALSTPTSGSHWPYPRGSQRTKQLTDAHAGQFSKHKTCWEKMEKRFVGKMEVYSTYSKTKMYLTFMPYIRLPDKIQEVCLNLHFRQQFFF